MLDTPAGYYTGYTVNLDKRLKEHKNGVRGAKFTRGFKPIELARAWSIEGSKSDAMKIEAKIKTMGRKQKEYLVKNPGRIKPLLNRLSTTSTNAGEKSLGPFDHLNIKPVRKRKVKL
ncbi:MAG: GIY-YIG nuclease family protein [Leptospirales bacterium]